MRKISRIISFIHTWKKNQKLSSLKTILTSAPPLISLIDGKEIQKHPLKWIFSLIFHHVDRTHVGVRHSTLFVLFEANFFWWCVAHFCRLIFTSSITLDRISSDGNEDDLHLSLFILISWFNVDDFQKFAELNLTEFICNSTEIDKSIDSSSFTFNNQINKRSRKENVHSSAIGWLGAI